MELLWMYHFLCLLMSYPFSSRSSFKFKWRLVISDELVNLNIVCLHNGHTTVLLCHDLYSHWVMHLEWKRCDQPFKINISESASNSSIHILQHFCSYFWLTSAYFIRLIFMLWIKMLALGLGLLLVFVKLKLKWCLNF